MKIKQILPDTFTAKLFCAQSENMKGKKEK
jgi:hypothetical protein